MSKSTRLLESIVRDLVDQGAIPEELAELRLPSDRMIDDLGLDSLGLSIVLMCIEDRFELEFPDTALESFRSVSDVVGYLDRATGGE